MASFAFKTLPSLALAIILSVFESFFDLNVSIPYLKNGLCLVVVAQCNFCNRDFVIAHKFSMGLRFGEFPRHSSTFTLYTRKIVFTFLDE